MLVYFGWSTHHTGDRSGMSNGNERSTLGNRWWCHEVGQEIQKEEPSRVGNKQRKELVWLVLIFKWKWGMEVTTPGKWLNLGIKLSGERPDVVRRHTSLICNESESKYFGV